MGESSGEKGECDKNRMNQTRLEDKKPVSLETPWVSKHVFFRNLENAHLFWGNDIAKQYKRYLSTDFYRLSASKWSI